ncbi:hypothetical protein HPB50_023897 [Hyalomma asiaticum]|uniref:Uncharacterized protein n=1 Tax=Hyalomma asiaticum TaxID=266040 RepID=A0ACB7TNL5_HYAAI|nr:hypothetical protein HPB50_023897 [Hyalomma asiaticum]
MTLFSRNSPPPAKKSWERANLVSLRRLSSFSPGRKCHCRSTTGGLSAAATFTGKGRWLASTAECQVTELTSALVPKVQYAKTVEQRIQSETHECLPVCALCRGPHKTYSRDCKQKFYKLMNKKCQCHHIKYKSRQCQRPGEKEELIRWNNEQHRRPLRLSRTLRLERTDQRSQGERRQWTTREE